MPISFNSVQDLVWGFYSSPLKWVAFTRNFVTFSDFEGKSLPSTMLSAHCLFVTTVTWFEMHYFPGGTFENLISSQLNNKETNIWSYQYSSSAWTIVNFPLLLGTYFLSFWMTLLGMSLLRSMLLVWMKMKYDMLLYEKKKSGGKTMDKLIVIQMSF